MFEFFIALFGGLFYISKYSNDKAKLKAFDEKQKEQAVIINNIKSRYSASTELEQWAKDLISSGQYFEDICNWFADDFQYVFGSD